MSALPDDTVDALVTRRRLRAVDPARPAQVRTLAKQTGVAPHEVQRRAVVAELADVRAELGHVPTALVRETAAAVGVSTRTVRRWLADAAEVTSTADAAARLKRPSASPAELTGRDIEVIYAHGGNLAAAWRDLRDDPACRIGSLTSLRRAWADQEPTVRAMATGGAKALLRAQPRTLYVAPHRNHTWRADHEELPVWVRPRGAVLPEKPWVTVVQDDATRMAMAVLYTFGRPSSEQVLAALAAAMLPTATNVPGEVVGGRPLRLITDNGADFTSGVVRDSLTHLGIVARNSYPYSSHQNGKIERFNRTTQDEFAARLPGFSHGPATLSGKRLFARSGDLLDEDVFRELLLDWVEEYNTERPHSSLDGRTPLEAWCEDPTPLRPADPALLRLSMLAADKPRKVQQLGVFFHRRYYQRLALAAHIGRDVVVRHLPYDESFIEVFTPTGEWITTAYPHPDLTDAELAAMEQRRREHYTNAREYLSRAAQRRAEVVAAGDLPMLRSVAAPADDLDTDGDLDGALDELAELAERAHRDAGDAPPPEPEADRPRTTTRGATEPLAAPDPHAPADVVDRPPPAMPTRDDVAALDAEVDAELDDDDPAWLDLAADATDDPGDPR